MKDKNGQELSEEELEKYSDKLWEKGSFIRSISSDELERMKKTINKGHDEDMNFNCRRCDKKISAHNRDWHDRLCDECFNKEMDWKK